MRSSLSLPHCPGRGERGSLLGVGSEEEDVRTRGKMHKENVCWGSDESQEKEGCREAA